MLRIRNPATTSCCCPGWWKHFQLYFPFRIFYLLLYIINVVKCTALVYKMTICWGKVLLNSTAGAMNHYVRLYLINSDLLRNTFRYNFCISLRRMFSLTKEAWAFYLSNSRLEEKGWRGRRLKKKNNKSPKWWLWIKKDLCRIIKKSYIQTVSIVTANIYCKSHSLPNTDVRNYSIDLR